MWSLLLVTLPTQPSAVRLRVWRALKSLGCAALRDGAYVLPTAADSAGSAFGPVAADVQAHGGVAWLMHLQPHSDAQRDAVLALFDRSAAYAQWRDSAQALQTQLQAKVRAKNPPALTEPEARRRLRTVADALQAVHQTDHYPGAAAAQAQAQLHTLRQQLEAHFSPGEPQARADHGIARLQARLFQGKRWATRARPKVDRLACAWLIVRHIDPQARFLWLADPAGATPAPRGALGFDYDGARFTHVGNRVSFEVMLASFGLDTDPRLQRLAALVHYLDAGGIPTPEAAGLDAVLAGLRELHTHDDDALLAAASTVFDALVAAPLGVGSRAP
jgi:hypothetical protein